MSAAPIDVLSPQHELFASHIASGISCRQAAREAGFHEQHGFRIMQMPAVRARIEELVNQPAERIRARVDAEFLILLNRACDPELEDNDRENIKLRMQLLMNLSKLRGWVVEKKQTTKATIDVSKMLNGSSGAAERAQLVETLGAMLNQLQPGARRRIEAIASGKAEPDNTSAECIDVASEPRE